MKARTYNVGGGIRTTKMKKNTFAFVQQWHLSWCQLIAWLGVGSGEWGGGRGEWGGGGCIRTGHTLEELVNRETAAHVTV